MNQKKKYYGQLHVHLKHLLTLYVRKTKYIEMQIDLSIQRQFAKLLRNIKVFCGIRTTNHLRGKSANRKESLLKPSNE